MGIALDLGLLQQGILLGLGAAAPIGPVNVEIARRTLRNGFGAGFALGCGAVSVDVAYAILSSITVGGPHAPSWILWPMRIAGPVFLLCLGAHCVRAAMRGWRSDPLESDTRSPRRATGAYFTGLLMTLLNPMTLFFWFVAVPGTVGSITDGAPRRLPSLCAGVFIGTISWVLFFACALSWAGRYRRQGWLLGADVAGGLTLIAFGLTGLWSSARRFL